MTYCTYPTRRLREKKHDPTVDSSHAVLRIPPSDNPGKGNPVCAGALTPPTGDEALVTQPPDSREMGYYFALAQIGLEMIAPMLLGLLLDYWLDRMPWLTVIGLILGFVGGMFHLVLMIRQHDAERRQPPGDAP
jgi:hypothetical protein